MISSLIQLVKGINNDGKTIDIDSFDAFIPKGIKQIKVEDFYTKSLFIDLVKDAKPVISMSRASFYEKVMHEELGELEEAKKNVNTTFGVDLAHLKDVFREMMRNGTVSNRCQRELMLLEDGSEQCSFTKREFGISKKDVYVNHDESMNDKFFLNLVCSSNEQESSTAYISDISCRKGNSVSDSLSRTFKLLGNSLDMGIEVWINATKKIQIAFSSDITLRRSQIGALLTLTTIRIVYDAIDEVITIEFHIPLVTALLSDPDNKGVLKEMK